MEVWEREHRQKLLLRGRCGRCAETVPSSAALRGRPCPHCGDRLVIPGGLGQQVSQRVGFWRLVIYPLVLFATLLGGLIPLLPGLIIFVATLLAHAFVVRRPMRWLGPARRITARFNLSLALAMLNALNLVVNLLILPFVGVSAVVASVVGTVLTVIYVEFALLFVQGRLAAEAREEPLKAWEWALPAGLVSLLVLTTVGSVASVALLAHALQMADLGWASEIASFLVGSS